MNPMDTVRRKSDGRQGRIMEVDGADQIALVLWNDSSSEDEAELVGFADIEKE